MDSQEATSLDCTDTARSARNKSANHNRLMIGGICVDFPVKPYPSQIAIMSKVS